MQLADLASLIRSKNAGPFFLTFDIMFATPETYQLVLRSQRLNAETFADLYGCSPEVVRHYASDSALAIKFSLPRPITQGDIGDGDLHGGQQFALLMSIDIPLPNGWVKRPRE